MPLPKLNIPQLDDLRHEVDRLFENFVGSTPRELLRGRGYPPVDVWEEGESVLVLAEIPGVSLERIEVFVRGNELTLKGTRPLASAQSSTVYRQELASGDFERRIGLPVEIEADSVEATLKDGLLTIRLRKSVTAQARRISVRGAGANDAAADIGGA